MPRDSHLFKECNEKIEELVLSLTLPLYFALSGLKTDVTQINTGAQGAMVVLVCFVATIGKVCHYFILSHSVISSPQPTILFLRFFCFTFYYYRYPQYPIIMKNKSASVNRPIFAFFSFPPPHHSLISSFFLLTHNRYIAFLSLLLYKSVSIIKYSVFVYAISFCFRPRVPSLNLI